MRHQIAHKHFNRDSNHRKALFKNLVRELVEHGEIVTTVAKAKVIKQIADKLIHKAQDASLTTRRTLHRFFGRRDAVNTLVERIAPAMTDRTSGFTRIETVGSRRGDNSLLVKLSLVNKPETIGTLKSGKTYVAAPKKPKAVAAVSPKAAPAKPAVKAAAKKAVAPKKVAPTKKK